MKGIICGDLHIGVKSSTQFIDYQINQFNKIIDYIFESEIENVFFLGDIFDSRQTIDIFVLSKILKCFERIEKLNVYMIAGNHDIYFKTSNNINSLVTIFKKYSFNIIDTKSSELIIEDEKVLFIPWMNKNNYNECLGKIKESNAKYCFGHFAINDFYLVRGIKELKGLKQSVFKKFKKVFSGHFHLKDDQKNIIYVGSITQLDWNDYGDKKRIIKFDTKKDIFKDIFIVENIFEKIIINSDDKIANLSFFENKINKIFIDKKLSSKDLSEIDLIKEKSLICDIIDNTIIFEEINENIKNEDFLELLEDFLNEQKNIDEKYIDEIKKYLKILYDKTLKGDL